MATHDDKKRTPPPATPPPADQANTSGEPGDKEQDPDLYDPVGMAGQKAGIVKEIEQEEGLKPDKDQDR